MAFDGITTKLITRELENIASYKVDSVYQPNKNLILLGLYAQGEHLNLLICIDSSYSRINLSTHLYKNPNNSPSFCMLLRKHLIGFKIKNIYTLDLERIVFLELENNENPNKPIVKKLIIELMGKHSNIILADANNIVIDSLRHTSVDEKSNRDIYPTARYIFPESPKYSFIQLKNFDDFYSKIEPKLTDLIVSQSNQISSLNISDYKIDKIISETYNGISSSFINNLIKKLNIQDISKKALYMIFESINDIIKSKYHIVSFNDTKKDFFIDKSATFINKYYINYSIDNFYFEKESAELFNNYKNKILNIVNSTLNKYKKRLLNINAKLDECKNKDKYKLYGELITSNLYKLSHRNLSSIELENYYDNNKIIQIALNPQYNPTKNANLYYKKYTKLKNTEGIVNIQREETINDINYLESILYEVGTSNSVEDLSEIEEELHENPIFEKNYKSIKAMKTKKNSSKKDVVNKFHPLKYTINGYTIFVGRNNRENDYLTCKYANKNDLWFHTKDIPGSHVILKVPFNETVSDEILLEIAKIAVKHSKANSSSHTPVDYCKVKDIKKPSASKPGFVIYKNNKTIYI